MANKGEELVGPPDQLSLQPPSPPLTTSPDSTTSSKKKPFREAPAEGVELILAELRNRRRGRPQQDSEWWCVPLSVDEFESLEAQIQSDEDLHGFVADKVKYDYFPRFSQFVLRMAHDLHEFVLGQFEAQIFKQLLVLEKADSQLAADFARKVISTRSPKIKLEARERHCPDGSFAHEDASDPGVIIEVSHSQKRKDLPFLADDYILGSNGTIQVVIGIDVEYRKKKGMEAKVIIWRPRDVEQDGETVLEASQTFEGIFRAEDGSLVNGNQFLRIQLKDFGNAFDCPGIGDISGEIAIPFSQLYDIVQRGDRRKQTVSRKRARSEVNPPGKLKQARHRSPPEELGSEDEKQFREEEEKIEQRLSDQESDYTPSNK